jgi:predicted AlkP superfamily phosphohydrolase/phosphomutase
VNRSAAGVLFLGLDAADAGLLRRGAADGSFPAFARLLARGAVATTRNPTALFVGAVWPSFTTALSPARHGRYCYEQHVPGTYRTKSFASADVRGAPFWRALDAKGRRTSVIDLPKAALDDAITGEQVCDWGTHDPDRAGFVATPAGLRDEVLAAIGPSPVGPCDGVRPDAEGLAALRDGLLRRMEARERWVASRLDAGFDLVVAGFPEAHCAGHQAWHLHDETHERFDGALRARVGDVVHDVYRGLDAVVGRLLEKAGSDRRVLVLASHGMGPHHDGSAAFDAMLERIEPLLPPGRPPRLRARWSRLVDRRRTRRWSRSLSKRLGFGLPLGSRLAARTCFAVPNNEAWAAVRLNVVGREPLGRLRPGAEADACLEALRARLAEVRNGLDGGPVFGRIAFTRDLHDGPGAGSLPDLVAEWLRPRAIDALVHPVAGRVDAPYRGRRTGDHTEAGLALATGPGIEPGESPVPARVEDLGPTLASWLGVDVPGVDGRPFPAFAPRAVPYPA